MMIPIWMNIAALALIILILYCAWASHSRLVALDERCTTASADVDVLLRHRHDLIPDLVKVVKNFAAHEHRVLTEVIEARSSALASQGSAKMQAETQLGQTIASVLALSEQYPELASSVHYQKLQDELTDTENRITAARRFFNLAVDEYNTTIRQFPGNGIASLSDLKRRDKYDLGNSRENIASASLVDL
ncbi:MAG: LemA family protein [Sphingomonadales bacterium]|nr:LemA family protein [Sphingomonadales bacterium]